MMLICRCNEVSIIEIRKFLKKYPHATIEELRRETAAGTNCGRCNAMLEKTFKRIKNEVPPDDQFRIAF